MKSKKILVTGGTGFLGTSLWRALAAAGAASIRLLDYRAPAGDDPERPEVVVADVRDAEAVRRACKGVEHVIHGAALPSIARGTWDTYAAINIGGTRNVLAGARAGGARKVVYVSSSTVYGVPARVPLREDDPLMPQGAYSHTKLEAERACWQAAAEGLSTSIIRPRVILGPGRLGVFSLLFSRVAAGKAIFHLGAGTNRFQFTHVRDVADACLRALERAESDVFNVGCDMILPVRAELAALVERAGSGSRIVGVPAAPCRLALRGLNRLGLSPLVDEQFKIADLDFVLDTTKARALLGWRPTASNLECLVEAYDWFVAHQGQDLGDGPSLFTRRRSDRQGAFQRA